MNNRPLWWDTVSEADFRSGSAAPTHAVPDHARVAIIGGGIIGLACAHYLAATGMEGIVVLERGQLMHEASAANGGGLWHNEQSPEATALHRLGALSLKLTREFAEQADGDLEYRRHGVLRLALSEAESTALQSEVEAGRAVGLAVEWVDAETARTLEPALEPGRIYGGAFYPEEGHINPARLGAAYARSALGKGVRLITGANVRGFEGLDHVTRLFTDEGTLDVTHVVVTTGAWAAEFAPFVRLDIPIVPARGQLVATASLPPVLNHAIVGAHCLLQTAAGHVVSGGTVEFDGFDSKPRPEVAEGIWNEAQALVPALRGVELSHSWARLRPHTPDALPLLGFCDAEQRNLIAAGHYKNGLLLAALTGKVVADLLTRGETTCPLEAVRPDRFAGGNGPNAG